MFEKYIKEFERLYIACDCRDQEEQKIAKFVLGLTKNLRNFVELQPLTTFDEVCSLACKMEKQHKGYRFGGFKIIKSKTENPITSKEGDCSKTTTQEVVDVLRGKLLAGGSKETPLKKVVCYKCQELGHVARNCPNRVLITRDEC